MDKGDQIRLDKGDQFELDERGQTGLDFPVDLFEESVSEEELSTGV